MKYWILAFTLVVVARALSHDPRVLITETSPDSDGNRLRGTIAGDVTLSCFVENKPADKDVRWQWTTYNPDRSVKTTTPISRDMGSEDVNKWSIEKPTDYTWRLRIKAIQVTDEGTYACFIQLTIDTIVLANRTLEATAAPAIIEAQMSPDQRLRQGENGRLMCNASGRPTPTIFWRREGNAILPGGGTIRFDNNLIINDAQSHYRGRYICEARNVMGMTQRAVSLEMEYPPIVNPDESHVTQKLGYKRTLICHIDANPASNQLSWTRDSRTVPTSDRVYERTLQGARDLVTYELVFAYVENEDFGTYTCRARNSHTSQPVEAQVTLDIASEPQRDKGYISGASHVKVTWVAFVVAMMTSSAFVFVNQ